MRCPAAVLSLLLSIVFAGCTAPTQWREFEHDAPFEDMWRGLVEIAEHHGFFTDAAASDRGERRFVSQWRELPAPFRRGYRDRLHAEFTRPEQRPGWYLRFWIEHQVVTDIARGFEAEEGDWKSAGQDTRREDVVLGQLRLRFGQELGVVPRQER